MSRLALFALLFVACTRVPDTVCFHDEPCADGGAFFGGGQGGGDGGGVGGGVGGGLGGGAGGGSGGGGLTPITPIHSSLGVSFDFEIFEFDLLSAVHEVAPRSFSVVPVALPQGLSLVGSGCSEAFRGALLLPDEQLRTRVLLIPACARGFVEVDLAIPQARVAASVLPDPNMNARFGGAVLGCDLRGYALPDETTSVVRLSWSTSGVLQQQAFPVFASAPQLQGGVVISTCLQPGAMRIVAPGMGGLYLLDVYEDGIVATTAATPNSAGVQFSGAARVRDDFVVTNFARRDATSRIALVYDARTGVTSEVLDFSPQRSLGVALASADSVLSVGHVGRVTVVSDGGVEHVRTFATSAARWPVNGLDGFIYVAGDDLVALDSDTGAMNDVNVLSPLPQGAESGGLLHVPGGHLVLVPGQSFDAGVILLRTGQSRSEFDVALLSPWLNKL